MNNGSMRYSRGMNIMQHPGNQLQTDIGWVDRGTIRTFSDPVSTEGGLISLRGNLAPDGAVFKRAAATPELFEVEGPAVVFDGLEDLANRIDDPDLDIVATDMTVGVRQTRPESKGYVKAISPDIFEPPEINPNYLSDPHDRDVLLRSIHLERKLMSTAPVLAHTHLRRTALLTAAPRCSI